MMSLKDLCDKRANVIIMVVVMTIYACLTISSQSFVNFNHDEVHAWNIASNFGFVDIVRLMRSEGHTFLWYLLIKPFTGCSMYAMKWINWVFTFSALIALWKFSPFRTPEKLLITFSCPFLLIYPVVSRCYGIGLLLLFAIAALYKRRFEYPVLFCILIFCTVNTSLMAAIPALVLGLLFGVELIKDKKIIPALILILAPLSLYIQWHNPIVPYYSEEYEFLPRVLDFLFGNFQFTWCSDWAKVVYPIVILSSLLFLRGKALVLWLISSLALISIFAFVYCGFDYHFYFLYVYLIMAFWINSENNKFEKFFVAAFCALSMLYCFKTVDSVWHFKTYFKENAECVMSGLPKGSKIYTSLHDHNTLIPYMDKNLLKDYDGSSLLSFENFQNIYTTHPEPVLEDLYKIAEPNSYLLIRVYNVKGLGLDYSDKTRFRECQTDILYKLK